MKNRLAKKISGFMCLVMLLSLIVSLSPSQASQSTFYVQGRYLYDFQGNKVTLIGANAMLIYWDTHGNQSYPNIAKTGANVCRIFWNVDSNISANDFDVALQNSINNKLIPMPSVWNATGKWSELDKCVDWWLSSQILPIVKKHQQYLLLNIANEAGDYSVSKTDWENKYKQIITRFRNAGVNCPLVIDAAGWGRDESYILEKGQSLVNHDPLKNIMFSWHPWDENQPRSRYSNFLDQAISKNLCVIVGEFAHLGVFYDKPIDWKAIIEECNSRDVGWLPWVWRGASSTDGHNITNNYVNYTSWGSQVVPYITAKAVRPPFLGGPGSSPTPTPTPTSTPTPTPTPGDLYAEDFNDNQAQGWTISSKYSVTGGKLTGGDWSTLQFNIYDGRTWSGTYTYKADFYTGGAGSDWNQTRIIFNYSNNNNYYYVGFGNSSTAGQVVLAKVVNGNESTISTYGTNYKVAGFTTNVEITYEQGGYITVKAKQGSTTTALFNRVQDTSLSSGKIGLGSRNTCSDFDNVYVSTQSSSPTPTPTATPTPTPTPTPTTTPTPTPTPGEVYAEDFNDNQAQGWTISSKYSVTGGKLTGGDWSTLQFNIYDGRTWSGTYTYKADFYTGGAGSDWNQTRIIFNYSNNNNYYYVGFGNSSTAGQVVLAKVVNGNESTISTYGTNYKVAGFTTNVEITYEQGGYITVKAKQGSTTTALFNRVQDTSLSSGKIGLGSRNTCSDFDNVYVAK